jgi:hypothetical protein
MFKKLLFLLFPAFLMAAFIVPGVFAADSGTAYITLRCTATISIELFSRTAGPLVAKTTYYDFGDVAAASTATALNPIGVRNNSQGAITSWQLDVTAVSGGWSLGATPGLDRAALYAKFSTATLTAADFDIVNDTVPNTAVTGEVAKPYSLISHYYYAYCSAYSEPTYSSDVSHVLPTSYDTSAEGKAERQLWLKLLTPTAVQNPNAITTITLRITAY